MSLQARLELTLGQLHLDVDIAVATGELVVLLGPNGAGKTTLLRALAGLIALDSGRVVLDDVVLDDLEKRVRVPTERRPIGFVFQDYLLFAPVAWAAPRPAATPPHGCSGSAWPITPGRGRRRCPAARPSGWPWPGPWSPTRDCSCWTSRWPRSTPPAAARSAATCAATSPPSTAPGCWSPTIRW